MTHDFDTCYRAVASRDPRFDGRFFTGVTSTGVYCRPICPARTPRRENCTFHASAAAAEAAGFRPCLRCRPETSPGTPAWQGTSATVTRALRLIDRGALDGAGGVEALAARLGVGPRHLRRLFSDELGAPPRAVARTRRLHFARKLVEETALPMGRVALAAGFGCARRFNAAFRAGYGQAPTSLRRSVPRPGADPGAPLTLRLAYRPPYAWDELMAYLGPRAIPGVEAVAGAVYRRAVRLGAVTGVVEAAHDPERRALELRVPAFLVPELRAVVARARMLFDLDADPAAIAGHLGADPLLAPLVARRPGLRVPGAWEPFETAVRAVLGQQVSVAAATTLSGRVVARHGAPVAGAPLDGPDHVFPGPEVLADADLDGLGLTGARVAAVQGLARAVCRDPDLLTPGRDLEASVAALAALPGLGPWTASYVALRVLREPDAFPDGDLGLRKAMTDGDRPPTPARLRARAAAWSPWRGYAALHLWTSLGDPCGRKKR